MAYLKVFSKTELNTDDFFSLLVFDYKCEDTDSVYYPEPTYEYFYDHDEDEESHEQFIDNLHLIYANLDMRNVIYQYDILDGEYHDTENNTYKTETLKGIPPSPVK